MRIAIIGPKRIPSRDGGIDVVIGKLAEGLSLNNQEVTIFVRKKKGERTSESYKGCKLSETFTIDKKTTGALVYSFFATIKGVFGKYDVLHFHAEGNTFFLWLTRFCRKRVLVTIHGLDWKRDKFKGLGSRVLLKSEKRIVKYADEIITLCKSDSDYFRERYGRETTIIPNGFEEFELTKAQAIKEKYGLEEGYILFLARIVPEKGLHYLISAYNQISIPQKLVIAGGDSHSKDYYSEMKELAKGNDKIVFTGFVQGRELEELYSNAYLYVLPSDIEGMPMSLLEALGHQRVCLVSDIEENRVDPMNCYYFKKGSVESLKEQLISISHGIKAYQKNSTLLDWTGVVKRTISVYEGKKQCE